MSLFTQSFRFKRLVFGLLWPALLVPGLQAGRFDERLSTTTKVGLAAVSAAAVGVVGYQLYRRARAQARASTGAASATTPDRSVASSTPPPSLLYQVFSTAFVGAVGLAYTAWCAMQNACQPAQVADTDSESDTTDDASDHTSDTTTAVAAVATTGSEREFTNLVAECSRQLVTLLADNGSDIVTTSVALQAKLKRLAQLKSPRFQITVNNWLHSWLEAARTEQQAQITAERDSQPQLAALSLARYQQLQILIRLLLDQGADFYSQLHGRTSLMRLPYDNEFAVELLRRYCGQPLSAGASAQSGPSLAWLEQGDESGNTAVEHYTAVASNSALHPVLRREAGLIATALQNIAIRWTNQIQSPAHVGVYESKSDGLEAPSDSESENDLAAANQSGGVSLNETELQVLRPITPAVVPAHQPEQSAGAAGAMGLPLSGAVFGADSDADTDSDTEWFDAPSADAPSATVVTGAEPMAAAPAAIASPRRDAATDLAQQRLRAHQELAALRNSAERAEAVIAAARRQPVVAEAGAAAAISRVTPIDTGVSDSKITEPVRPASGVGPAATTAVVSARTAVEQEKLDDALLEAASKLDLTRVRAAVEQGANVNVVARGWLNGPRYNWLTPLELAVAGIKRPDQLPTIEYLIAQGAQVFRPTTGDLYLGMRTFEARFSALEYVYSQATKAPQLVIPLLRALAVGMKRDYTLADRQTWLNEKRWQLKNANDKTVLNRSTGAPVNGNFHQRLLRRLPSHLSDSDRAEITQILVWDLGGDL